MKHIEGRLHPRFLILALASLVAAAPAAHADSGMSQLPPQLRGIKAPKGRGFGQNGFGQNGFGQNGFGQNGFGQNGFGQNGFGQNGFGQFGGFGGGFGGGQAPEYKKNETTKELGKAAEKYQKSIEESSKQFGQATKEQTSSFLSSLDKLKVPDVGGDFAKQISGFNDAITGSSKGSQAAFEALLDDTKKNNAVEIDIVKAQAKAQGPNGAAGNTGRLDGLASGAESIGQRIQGYISGRSTQTTNGTLDLAMGAEAGGNATAGVPLPNLGGNLTTSGQATAAPRSRAAVPRGQVYNFPEGVILDP